MPDFGETASGRGSIQRLIQFVRATYEVLGKLVESERDPQEQLLFLEELLPPMRAAWREVRPHFEELERAIDALPDQQIYRHGFSEGQLDFKLGVVASWWNRFSARGGRRIAKKLLDAIDNVLDSLIDATGVGGAIKEIKDAINGSIEDE